MRVSPGAPPGVKEGTLPSLKLGEFDLPQVPAMQGAPLAELRSSLDVDVGGIMGAGLLSIFRVTFADDGRFLWFEPDPMMSAQSPARANAQPPPGGPKMQPDVEPPKPEPKPTLTLPGGTKK
jgi:hypothetical protein